MNVTRKVLYFVAIILLYCCKIFFLLYRNLTWFPFSVQGFLCVCGFFFCQYSECLHLFDISHSMPLSGSVTPAVWQQREIRSHLMLINKHERHRGVGETPDVLRYFFCPHSVKLIPSFGPLPKKTLFPRDKLGKWFSESSEGGVVGFGTIATVWCCYALLCYPTRRDWVEQAF